MAEWFSCCTLETFFLIDDRLQSRSGILKALPVEVYSFESSWPFDAIFVRCHNIEIEENSVLSSFVTEKLLGH